MSAGVQNIVRTVRGRGRGVFAAKAYAKGSVVEVAPVVRLTEDDWKKIRGTTLHAYPYEWPGAGGAIVLGHGSLYNHSARPNAVALRDRKRREMRYVALRAIRKGEEITVDYTGGDPDHPLWFTPR